LTTAGREQLEAEGFPKNRTFFKWIRKTLDLHVSEQYYAPLKTGDAVPWPLLEALVKYRAEVQRQPVSIAGIAEPAAAPAKKKGWSSGGSAWRWGWPRLLWVVGERFDVPDEAECAGPADLDLAARMTVEATGRATSAGRLSAVEAIAQGEQEMKRSVDSFSAWLRILWDEDPRTVMFGVRQRGAKAERLGVNVVVPLKKRAYELLRQGKLDDSALTGEHLESPSRYLLYQVASSSGGSEGKGGDTTFMQVHTMAYQTAMLLPDLKRGGVTPCIVAVGGTKENERHAKAYGFVATGSVLPTSGKPVYEVSAEMAGAGTGFSGALRWRQYAAMRGLLEMYQGLFRSQRAAMED
jgi:hypothetical protein